MKNNVNTVEQNHGFFQRFLDFLEFVGNKFPSPFLLFSGLAVSVLILSALFSGASATYMGVGGKQTTVTVVNLLQVPTLQGFLQDALKNFIQFPPLGLVVLLMMAMGLAEGTGFIICLVKRLLQGVPDWGMTAAIFFIGINGNLASDAAMIVMPAIAASVYAAMGRNPLLGMSIAFSATAAGFSANILPAGTDALMSGITQTAIKMLPETINSPAHILINYYFMSSSVVILTTIGTIVAEKIVAPRLDTYMPYMRKEIVECEEAALKPEEIRGLRFAGWAGFAFLAVLLALALPEHAFLRNPKTLAFIPKSPLLDGMIPILFAFFFTLGTAFGVGKGVIKNFEDIGSFLAEGVKSASGFIVTAFPAAQFITWFGKSNLASVLSIKGAYFLQSIDFTGIALVVAFILLCGIADMLLTSGSAKWLFFSPIFIPMFALLGYEPALVQAAYRLGESVTNPISPLNFYIPVIIGIASRYIDTEKKPIGYGTIIAAQLPFSIWFLIGWGAWLITFMVMDWPLGPGVGVYLK